MIYQIFPTLIFEQVAIDPLLTKLQNQIELVLSHKQLINITEAEHPRIGNFQSTGGIINLNDNFIEDNNLSLLKELILNNAVEYLEKVKLPQKIIIKDSWVTKFLPENSAQEHDHRPDVLSGVYYFKATGVEGNLRLVNPTAHKNFIKEQIYDIMPITGKMVLFPGWLRHQVLTNHSQNERISIAFNLELIYE